VLLIKVVAALLLLLGSGLIFKALVEMDAPTFGPRSLPRRPLPDRSKDDHDSVPLRRAA
jgi:hypothetical protein